VDVVELCAHQRAEDASPPVRWQDADEGHPRGADEPTGDARLEREGAAAADDGAVVEGGVDPIRRDDRPEALGDVGAGRAPEVMEDRTDHVRELLRRGRADLVAQAMRSSGA
jgi:hypothetical protein